MSSKSITTWQQAALITPGPIVGLGKSQLKQLKKELNGLLNFVAVHSHSGRWVRLGGGMN